MEADVLYRTEEDMLLCVPIEWSDQQVLEHFDGWTRVSRTKCHSHPDRMHLQLRIKSMISDWAKESITLYVESRIHPGDFLFAVLSNDLKEACSRADDNQRYKLFDTVCYCYNNIPACCWGSPERVKSWLANES